MCIFHFRLCPTIGISFSQLPLKSKLKFTILTSG